MITQTRIDNAINMLNLERPDIAALDGNERISYRLQDIRELVSIVKELWDMVENGDTNRGGSYA